MSGIRHMSQVGISVDESLKKVRRQWWPNIFGATLGAAMLGLVSWFATHTPADPFSGSLFYIAAGAFVGFIPGLCVNQIRIWTTRERTWHLQNLAIAKKVELFNVRLAALQAIESNMEKGDWWDPAITKECENVKAALLREMRAHARKRAIQQFEAAVAKDPDPQFRSTRQDLASHVLVARIRVADQSTEPGGMTTALEEDERFTALEKTKAQHSP